jgi:hypothetical protein
MRRIASIIFLFGMSNVVCAQSIPKITTTDITNFWIAFDSLATSRDSLQTIQRLYIQKGTTVLKRFVKSRDLKASTYLSVIKAFPQFWKSIRQPTSNIENRGAEIEIAFQKLRRVYPKFKSPEVFFLIGCLNSGGTTGKNRIIIGSEIAAATNETVKWELPSWQKSVMGTTGDIPIMIAHEAVHTQQRLMRLPFIWGYLNHRLLTMSLSEGAADFISQLAMGEAINKANYDYGIQNEKMLWQEFRSAMMKNDLSNWLYNGNNSKTRPADLGYFMGAQICKAFYDRSENKAKAIKKILRMKYNKRFVARSGYAKKFE